jgi:hypothetical protein
VTIQIILINKRDFSPPKEVLALAYLYRGALGFIIRWVGCVRANELDNKRVKHVCEKFKWAAKFVFDHALRFNINFASLPRLYGWM